MIKATMVCTNCHEEKEIPPDELLHAFDLNSVGELNLCSDCRKLWETAMKEYKEYKAKEFAAIQKRFGIKG